MSTEIAIRNLQNDLELLDIKNNSQRIQFGEEFEIILYKTTFFTLKDIWLKTLLSKVEALRKYAMARGYWCGCSVDVSKQCRRYIFKMEAPLLLTGKRSLPPPPKDMEKEREYSKREFMHLTRKEDEP